MREIYAISLGILILTISANFTGELFNCSYRRALKNPLVKHLIAFFLLLFFIILTSKDQFVSKDKKEDDKLILPELLYYVIIIYLAFIVVIKSDFLIFIGIVFLLTVIMLLNIERENKSEEMTKKIDTYIQICEYLAIIFAIIGFGSYLNKQIKEQPKFDIYKFLIGSTECRDV